MQMHKRTEFARWLLPGLSEAGLVHTLRCLQVHMLEWKIWALMRLRTLRLCS